MPPARPLIASADDYYRFRLRRAPLAGAGTLADQAVVLLLKAIPWDVALGLPCEFPQVRRLSPFACAPDEVSPQLSAVLGPEVGRLKRLGFRLVRVHEVPHPLIATTFALGTLIDARGTVMVRISVRLFGHSQVPQVHRQCWSQDDDGRVVVTHDRGWDLGLPPGWEQHCHRKRPLEELYDRHRRHVRASRFTVWEEGELDLALDALQRDLVEHNAARGILVPLDAEERKRQAALLQGRSTMDRSGFVAAREEFERLQQQSGGMRSAIALLIISGLAFAAASVKGGGWSLADLPILIGVLLFHEAGHWAAMRAFGYRNLRMFFIPFFGAAVSGQQWSVPVWKQVLVALAGPGPGILLGVALAAVGWVTEAALPGRIALVMLIINGMNLLPVMPLDGGWVAHHLLFARVPALELGFRILGILAMAGLWLADPGIGLAVAVVFGLIGLPFLWRVAITAHRLRRQGHVPTSSDGVVIDGSSAEPILEALHQGRSRPLAPTVAAQSALAVCERLAVPSPRWPIAVGLLTAQAALLVVAIVGGLFSGAAVARATAPGFFALLRDPVAAEVRTWHHPGPAAHGLLVAQCPDVRSALRLGERLAELVPPALGVAVLGDVVLVEAPAAEAEREALLRPMEKADRHAHHTVDPLELELTRAGDRLSEPMHDLEAFLSLPDPAAAVAPWQDRGPGREERHQQRDLVRCLVEIAHPPGDALVMLGAAPAPEAGKARRQAALDQAIARHPRQQDLIRQYAAQEDPVAREAVLAGLVAGAVGSRGAEDAAVSGTWDAGPAEWSTQVQMANLLRDGPVMVHWLTAEEGGWRLRVLDQGAAQRDLAHQDPDASP